MEAQALGDQIQSMDSVSATATEMVDTSQVHGTDETAGERGRSGVEISLGSTNKSNRLHVQPNMTCLKNFFKEAKVRRQHQSDEGRLGGYLSGGRRTTGCCGLQRSGHSETRAAAEKEWRALERAEKLFAEKVALDEENKILDKRLEDFEKEKQESALMKTEAQNEESAREKDRQALADEIRVLKEAGDLLKTKNTNLEKRRLQSEELCVASNLTLASARSEAHGLRSTSEDPRRRLQEHDEQCEKKQECWKADGEQLRAVNETRSYRITVLEGEVAWQRSTVGEWEAWYRDNSDWLGPIFTCLHQRHLVRNLSGLHNA